ncbi:MAG: PAS domain-containing protein [Synergistales bacterium]|nr:PAS domain-containing protein [Synergistales bacterium]
MKRLDSIDPFLAPFVPVVETVASQFGANCEVALHDLRHPQSSLIAISGFLTDRPLGAPITNYVLNLIKRHGDDVADSYHYGTTTKDGKQLKSSTTFIRDGEGHVIGCLCINFCIEAFLFSAEALKEFCAVPCGEENDEPREQFSSDVTEVVGTILEETLRRHAMPPSRMEKPDKMAIVEELDNRGLFLVKGAIDLVASRLEISKFTLYGYLDQIKKSGNGR